jgi:PAS domain S-box-containing protein
MRKFIHRALKKLDKLDKDQVHSLLYDMAAENERLEIVLESMTEGVIVCDTEHNLILYNKSAERLFYFAGSDVHEKKVWSVIEDEEIAGFLENSLKNQEKVVDKEFSLEIGSKVRILAISIMPLVKDGSIQGNIIHINDITEQREEEAKLRRAERLASLTTLAAGVAHEIKNPLGSMSIHIQLIKKAINGKECVTTDQVEKNLGIINEEVNRLNGIVVDFLFAVRPMDTQLEEGDLNKVIREVLEFVKVELENAGVELKQYFSEEIPYIKLDDKYLKQALLNIIKNGISAMPDGGTLTVSTWCEHDYVVLKVEDTGVGIPNDLIDKIFEPYFTTKDFGSGLGLTVVYKIVKEHFGEISVKSKEHEGTSFYLRFPIPQKEKRLLGWQGENDEV